MEAGSWPSAVATGEGLASVRGDDQVPRESSMSRLLSQPASVIGLIAKNGNKCRRSSVSSYGPVRKPKYRDVRMKLLRLLLPPAALASVFLMPPQSFAADPGVPSGFYFGG